MISKLYAAHQAGDKNSGVDIEGEGAAVKDVVAAGILDLYLGKWWGLKLATGAVNTVLRVDQVGVCVCVCVCSLITLHGLSTPYIVSLSPSYCVCLAVMSKI